MRDSSFGIPIVRDTSFPYDDHRPSTVEITKPHPLLKPLGSDYTSTRLNYVTVRAYDNQGNEVGWHHVTKLPGRLGSTATQLMASAWATRFALKV